jgi:hypothetical protein
MARNSPLFAAVALTALLSCAKATPLGDDPVLLTAFRASRDIMRFEWTR